MRGLALCPLAAEHGEEKTVMIDATYLKAHRTAASMCAKKGGVDAWPSLISSGGPGWFTCPDRRAPASRTWPPPSALPRSRPRYHLPTGRGRSHRHQGARHSGNHPPPASATAIDVTATLTKTERQTLERSVLRAGKTPAGLGRHSFTARSFVICTA